MLKLFDYLYYKLYRAHLKGSLNDIAEFAALVLFCLLIFENFFVLSAFLRKVDLLPLFFTDKRQVIICFIVLLSCCSFLFLYKKRYKKIIIKFEQETEVQRRKGNLIVSLYVIISFLLIFAVAFYKPGKI